MNQHIYPPTQKHKTPYMNLHKNPHNPRPFTEESQLEGTIKISTKIHTTHPFPGSQLEGQRESQITHKPNKKQRFKKSCFYIFLKSTKKPNNYCSNVRDDAAMKHKHTCMQTNINK